MMSANYPYVISIVVPALQAVLEPPDTWHKIIKCYSFININEEPACGYCDI